MSSKYSLDFGLGLCDDDRGGEDGLKKRSGEVECVSGRDTVSKRRRNRVGNGCIFSFNFFFFFPCMKLLLKLMKSIQTCYWKSNKTSLIIGEGK